MLEVKSIAYRNIIAPTSFTIEAGTTTALLGSNGAGKTTLLKTIALLLKPSFGDLLFFGDSLLTMTPVERKSKVAFVPHEMTIAFSFTLSEFLDMGFYPDPPSIEKKSAALNLVHLEEKSDYPIDRLSSGEKRRAYLARALLSKASLFLFDEVTASLDELHQKVVWDIIASLTSEGKSVLMSTHDKNGAELHADAMLYLERGTLVS